MANHIRQQIRERVGTTLTGLTTTGSNVFQSRVYNLENAKLPAIIIYTKSEDSELLEMGSTRTLQRNLSLVVEAYVKANTNFDDTIDTIAKEVESAMGADVTHNSLARDTFLDSTEINYNAEGEQPVAVMTMVYNINYLTTEATADVAL
tara:strand:+ start:939 stop:1385 length:447 start_codon:yes stop_codon:yes gene_type:complete